MSIICWGNLAKSADSTQRIEQAIEGYIKSHDENPNAHMGADYALGAHRMQTILDHPPGSVKYYHVYDIHAEQITAGAMIIKGGGPYISVRDTENNERVKIYPEGIIVKNGLISVQNDNNEVIIDKKGVWGSNIFYTDKKTKTSSQTMSGDFDFQFLEPLEFGFYLSRPSPVMIFGMIGWYSSAWDASPVLTVQYPGGYWPSNGGMVIILNNSGMNWGTYTFITILKLAAGQNFLRLLGARSTPDATVVFGGLDTFSEMSYMVMGN